mmetsp:Transcript_44407/g.106986  ORF Transcript_44407/g.106986 Transcript_44407/m.106986 type:complete len:213 (+) Transcript_44407:420-1058(+)
MSSSCRSGSNTFLLLLHYSLGNNAAPIKDALSLRNAIAVSGNAERFHGRSRRSRRVRRTRQPLGVHNFVGGSIFLVFRNGSRSRNSSNVVGIMLHRHILLLDNVDTLTLVYLALPGNHFQNRCHLLQLVQFHQIVDSIHLLVLFFPCLASTIWNQINGIYNFLSPWRIRNVMFESVDNGPINDTLQNGGRHKHYRETVNNSMPRKFCNSILR